MCTFEHVLGRLVEVHHVVLLDVHLLYLLHLASKVSSVAYQIHILYLTELFGDGSEALNCNLRIFLSDLVEKCPEVSYYDSPQLGG